MGLGTISEARKLLLLASGKAKANAVARALEGPVSSLCPASIIQMHPDVTLVLDEEAASELRFYHFEGMAEPLEFSTN
jgi:glucosamine-6-phosphate deaminase